MFDTFWKYCGEHWPKLTFFGIVIILAIIITWQIAKKVFHWTGRIKKTESDCSKIDTHILPQLTSINTSINNLVVYLKTKDGKLDISLFRSMSPIQLTPLGYEILEKIGGKYFIDSYINDLITNIDSFGIKTALDVQNAAPIIISNYSTKDSFNHIKDYIFKSPTYKVSTSEGDAFVNLDFSTITNIMGIYLRNKYLDLHPELNPEDIPSTITENAKG